MSNREAFCQGKLTKPSPGRRALFIRVLGNSEIIGSKESSSLHSTFKAGSHMALQVRARRDMERRPLGESMMVSNSFLAASGSRRIVGNIVC